MKQWFKERKKMNSLQLEYLCSFAFFLHQKSKNNDQKKHKQRPDNTQNKRQPQRQKELQVTRLETNDDIQQEIS